MEPLFFKAENRKCGSWPSNSRQVLQWSRFFSKRKIPQCRELVHAKVKASMEPLFFKAENLTTSPIHRHSALASMEPLFFKAENVESGAGYVVRSVASMEPLFFKAENSVALLGGKNDFGLQWSRFFSKRKISERDCNAHRTRTTLQWSRFFSKRKILRDALQALPNGDIRFNGAAFFQSGKSDSADKTPLGCTRFNGAAFFQSGK